MKTIRDLETVKTTCKLGQEAECCRFLVAGASGFECAKHDYRLGRLLNYRVICGEMISVGDNCEGLR